MKRSFWKMIIQRDWKSHYPNRSDWIWRLSPQRLPVVHYIGSISRSRSGSRQNNIVIFIIRCQHSVRLPFVLDRLAVLYRCSYIASYVPPHQCITTKRAAACLLKHLGINAYEGKCILLCFSRCPAYDVVNVSVAILRPWQNSPTDYRYKPSISIAFIVTIKI